MHKKVTICMSLYQADHWIGSVVQSIQEQTYPSELIQVLTWHNTESDNIGFWAGVEKLLPQATGEYVIALTDVILDPHFIERAVEAMEADVRIGALQAKILQPDHRTIDTTGFQVSRSRRVTNRGHGEIDRGQYDTQIELIAVEGAVPVFRREALEDCRIDSWIIDPAYRVGPLGYGDDLDLAWRMRVFGWRQVYAPQVIGYHDRSTTRGIATTPIIGQLSRRALRQAIPIQKRRLDWSNVRFTIIKNDYIINILPDLPYILLREIAVAGYTLLFEPGMFMEASRFLRLLPLMFRRRKAVMAKARATPRQMHSLLS